MDSASVYGLKLLVLEETGGKTLATDHRANWYEFNITSVKAGFH